MDTKLKNRIMRRVYYALALRIATNPAIVHGFVMLALLIVLTRFVSLGNVLNNLLNTKLNYVPTYAYNAITNTEAWTLLVVGAFAMAALSLRWRLVPRHVLKVVH